MFLCVVQVEVHLTSVGVPEAANFQVNDDQAAQAPMEENEIDTEPCVIQPQTALTPKESEVIAKFQKEITEMLD